MVAEDLLDRARLGEVAERRRGPVRVDVADTLRVDVCALERRAHHLAHADRLGLGLGHVVRVVRGAVAEHLGVDPRAARRACSSSSSTSVHAPSPITNPSRVASNGREARGGCSSSAARPRIAQKPARISGWMHASVPPRDHGVGVAAPDQLGALADRVRAGRAGGDGRVVRPADPERDRELPAGRVDEDVREEVRRDAVRPALAQHVGLLHDPEQPADRGAEHDPDARRVEAVRAPRPRPPPCAEASASRTFRSSLRASLAETTVVGSKPLTSAAIRTGKPSVSNAPMKSTPLRPRARRPTMRTRRSRSASPPPGPSPPLGASVRFTRRPKTCHSRPATTVKGEGYMRRLTWVRSPASVRSAAPPSRMQRRHRTSRFACCRAPRAWSPATTRSSR